MQLIRQAVSRNALTLGLFAIIATSVVVLVANLTADSIAKAMADTLKKSLFEVMPEDRLDNDLLSDKLTLDADKLLGTKTAMDAWVARQAGQSTGAILQVVAPEGYGGSINLLVGIDAQGTITGVRVIPPHFETPGLGDAIEIQKSPWIQSFNGKSLQNTQPEQWRVKKDGGEFDAFTGATITPRTVVDAVHKALQYFKAHQQTILDSNKALAPETSTETAHAGH